ncbi:hypothetical protein NA57DRAFT_74526 [Rhizodiscina lignyota]|uniref:Uncharacterized protein n=1 Tax=Rhizodiscina lignyota TaxID=1504668 RepID=A0A9P4MCR7_9PEZI|nr:hypothetical protein NA57DRAFT_74526 [Rhizodiscina lignyota]
MPLRRERKLGIHLRHGCRYVSPLNVGNIETPSSAHIGSIVKMGKRVVTLCKFVGTVSLGLLTGLSYTLSTSTLPALLALPTAPTASRAYSALKSTALRHSRLLTNISIASLAFAYILSPPRAKHPYLLWTGLITGLGSFGVDYFFRGTADVLPVTSSSRAEFRDGRQTVVLDADEEMGVKSVSSENGETSGSEHDEEEVNGEELRRAMERFRTVQGIRASVNGLAFVMGVVGIWGDGF